MAGTSARAAARRPVADTACAGVAPIDSHASTSGQPAATSSVNLWPARVVAVMAPPTSWATNGTPDRADSGRAPVANTTAAAAAAPHEIAAAARPRSAWSRPSRRPDVHDAADSTTARYSGASVGE